MPVLVLAPGIRSAKRLMARTVCSVIFASSPAATAALAAMTCPLSESYIFFCRASAFAFSKKWLLSSLFFASRASQSACCATGTSAAMRDTSFRSALTLHLVLQRFDLGVGVVNELIHLLAEYVVLVSQSFGEVFLVNDLL
jgi:hypothetical protein